MKDLSDSTQPCDRGNHWKRTARCDFEHKSARSHRVGLTWHSCFKSAAQQAVILTSRQTDSGGGEAASPAHWAANHEAYRW